MRVGASLLPAPHRRPTEHQARGDVLADGAEVPAHALADRFRGPEAVGALVSVDAEAFAIAVINGDEEWGHALGQGDAPGQPFEAAARKDVPTGFDSDNGDVCSSTFLTDANGEYRPPRAPPTPPAIPWPPSCAAARRFRRTRRRSAAGGRGCRGRPPRSPSASDTSRRARAGRPRVGE